MSSYEFRDHYGYCVTVAPARIPSPSQHMPAVTISPEVGNIIWVPLDRLEEVVAGLRDMARQAGGAAPRTTVLLEDALDIARNEAHRLEAVAGIEAARGARCVAFLLRRLAEGHRPATLTEADYEDMARQAGGQAGAVAEQAVPRCICGDPIERWTGPGDPGWIHSPGSDTPCLDARPASPWPSRERWRVETLDPVANEWAAGSSMASRGSTVRRRIVRETTSYSVEET